MVDYLISYRPRVALGRKHLKVISYTTPLIKIGAYDWIIVVDKSMMYNLGRRRIHPMWRPSEPIGHDKFPIEWNDMESWLHFDLNDEKNLGLPRALRKGYRKYRDTILQHAF